MNYDKQISELRLMFELAENGDARDIVLVCRNTLEKAIDLIFEVEGYQKPTKASMIELIDHECVHKFFGTDVLLDSLHFVRIVGSNALHEKHIKKTHAKVAYENTETLLTIIEEKLGYKEINNDKSIQSNEAPVSTNASGNKLTEAETRSIYIDLYLNEAGWDVAEPGDTTILPNGKKVKSGSVIPGKACCEIKVDGLPTASGIGFCDYVLYAKNGKPLAIIEAKKTSVDSIKGQQQVREYGQCMLKQYGYVPVLYYTNGYNIFVIDGKYPPRKVSGFHTIDELERLIQKRDVKKISDMKIRDDIAGRPYQKIAITNICERFNAMQRRGLLVMATGTGKTRTAIALTEILTRSSNNWVKNVLFLADRTSLVRQAFKNFQKILPDMTYSVVSDPSLANEPNARITFSTHQTMINYIDDENKQFTPGRFDLIIIDEAHRSIFNKYGAIFNYFDSLLVGLTATPKDEVDANTYRLFNCESGIPNFSYSLEEAVKDKYLVPYKLVNRKSKLMTEGIGYSELSDEDQQQLDLLSDVEFDYDSTVNSNLFFRKIFNKDTCRKVFDDLMSIGLRVEQGQTIGKTIIFAVNHYHADLIVKTFNEMYPMYPNYCKLIDNQVKNSEHLIEEFENDPEFRIAVSVDMLDTGIDVPEVLNLVFFKKVNSNIKLVQMIGRGTRLCEGLIDGEDKRFFYIFDYFNNFKDELPDQISRTVTIAQKLFTIRINILCKLQSAEHQINKEHKDYYEELKKMSMEVVKNIKKYGSERIDVRESMSVVDKYCDENEWSYLSALAEKEILYSIMPLVQSDIKEHYLNFSFDYKMLEIEKSLIENGDLSKVANQVKKIRLIAQTLMDKASITEINNKLDDLQEVYNGQIWTRNSVAELEYYRKSIRHLMKYLEETKIVEVIIDQKDETEAGEYIETSFVDIRTYKEKVFDYLLENSTDETLNKIKNLEALNADDFKKLEDILWNELGSKDDYYGITEVDNLAVFIRSIIGINQEAINHKFSEFLNNNTLNSQQQEFIYSIINYVRENGDIEPITLVEEEPFEYFSILDLFEDKMPIINMVLNTLHNCVVPA